MRGAHPAQHDRPPRSRRHGAGGPAAAGLRSGARARGRAARGQHAAHRLVGPGPADVRHAADRAAEPSRRSPRATGGGSRGGAAALGLLARESRSGAPGIAAGLVQRSQPGSAGTGRRGRRRARRPAAAAAAHGRGLGPGRRRSRGEPAPALHPVRARAGAPDLPASHPGERSGPDPASERAAARARDGQSNHDRGAPRAKPDPPPAHSPRSSVACRARAVRSDGGKGGPARRGPASIA
jgi:hypothetical protein